MMNPGFTSMKEEKKHDFDYQKLGDEGNFNVISYGPGTDVPLLTWR